MNISECICEIKLMMGNEASFLMTLFNWQVFDSIVAVVLFSCKYVCVIELRNILHRLLISVDLS